MHCFEIYSENHGEKNEAAHGAVTVACSWHVPVLLLFKLLNSGGENKKSIILGSETKTNFQRNVWS